MTDWAELERLALHDPILHATVTRVQQGASREQALIAAAITFSKAMRAFTAARVDAMYYGNGFVRVTHASGEFSHRRLDPASIIVKGSQEPE